MTVPPWTHSRLEAFETCPKQFYHLKVKKDVTELPSEQQLWGTRVHEALEHRIRDGAPLPEGMQQWNGLVRRLEAIPGETRCEMEMSLDRNFQPTEWGKSWTRGIADLVKVDGVTGAVFDYKTGKRKLSSQLRLYAAKLFTYYPKLQVISTGFIWLKDRKITLDKVRREEVPGIWQEYLPRVRQLELAYEKDAWPARPSGLCNGWCPVGRARCGYCKQGR